MKENGKATSVGGTLADFKIYGDQYLSEKELPWYVSLTAGLRYKDTIHR